MGTKQASKSLELMESGGEIVTKLKVFNSPGMNQNKITKQKKARIFYKRLSNKADHRPPFGFLVWFSVLKHLQMKAKHTFPQIITFTKIRITLLMPS